MNSTAAITTQAGAAFTQLHDTPDLPRIRIALLALLPKDGTPISVAKLAATAFVSKAHVTDALFDDYMDGRLGFDVRADTFWTIRQPAPGARRG